MCINFNPAKFYPNSIWNEGALGGFFEVVGPKKKSKTNSDMRLVPHL